jgi:gamma-glutamyl phosphate reductase
MANEHSVAVAIAESRRIDAVQEAEKERVNSLLAAQKSDVVLAASRAEGVATALADRVDVSAKTLARCRGYDDDGGGDFAGA